MTLSQLKKLMPIGTRVRLVRSIHGPQNSTRTVTAVTRSGFKMEDGNGREWHLPITPRHDIEKTPAGFVVRFSQDGTQLAALEYEWAPDATKQEKPRPDGRGFQSR